MSSERPGHAIRSQVVERASGCCEYCLSQREFSPAPFSIEHLIPFSRGGATEPGNLALSCQGCNNLKFTAVDATDPVTLHRVALYHPRQDRWSDHFAWSSDYLEIIGITATGRATVERLPANCTAVRRSICSSIARTIASTCAS